MAAALGGYLLGSVSFAWLAGRWKRVDLRAVGSGNLGATNVGRALGAGLGFAVWLLDAAKGAAAAWLGLSLGAWQAPGGDGMAWDCAAIAAGTAVAGHVWPLYLRFRGGKGVATLMGALVALAPVPLLAAAAAQGLVIAVTRFMSAGSLALGAALPVSVWILGRDSTGDRLPVLVLSACAPFLLAWTHRGNIRRLLRGLEPRLGRRCPGQGSGGDA